MTRTNRTRKGEKRGLTPAEAALVALMNKVDRERWERLFALNKWKAPQK